MTDEKNTTQVSVVPSRPSLLRSLTDRKVLQALTSLKKKQHEGIPKLAEVAAEIQLLGYDVPTDSEISRSITNLEKKNFIKRDLTVLAQEGGAA